MTRDPVTPELRVIDQAVNEYQPVATYALFSGGHDSLTSTAIAARHATFAAAVHINTGIGIEQTREFVRETCRANGWPLIELHSEKRYEDWVLVEREHYRQIRLHALERIALELAAEGRFGRAAETALAAVATEPLRESAHRALISIHLAQGNRSEAIRQYCIYRRILREELDIEPSSQMEQLVGAVPPAVIARMAAALTPP